MRRDNFDRAKLLIGLTWVREARILLVSYVIITGIAIARQRPESMDFAALAREEASIDVINFQAGVIWITDLI